MTCVLEKIHRSNREDAKSAIDDTDANLEEGSEEEKIYNYTHTQSTLCMKKEENILSQVISYIKIR